MRLAIRAAMGAAALVVAAGGFTPQDVTESWRHNNWLAAQADRPARGREELAQLIDTNAYAEALALEGAL
ncbi:MAG TPA: hypothetical protein VLA45_16345 [Paracoccaceae bacterium]|nr:hypothetical protein [Paracoccaceae bacterium]